MTFYQKLAAFWICVSAIFIIIRLRPHSSLAKLLLSWQGPFPKHQETESAYSVRYALWALIWFLQITAVFIVGTYVFAKQYSDSIFFMVFFEFTLPFLGVLALSGSILLLAKAFVCKIKSTKK